MRFYSKRPNLRVAYGGVVVRNPQGVPIRTGSRHIQFRNGIYNSKNASETKFLKSMIGPKNGIFTDQQIEPEEKHVARCQFCGKECDPRGVKSHERVCKMNPANEEPEDKGDMTVEPDAKAEPDTK